MPLLLREMLVIVLLKPLLAYTLYLQKYIFAATFNYLLTGKKTGAT